MSPKKEHEVLRSVAYISQLLGSLDLDARNLRIVDIGAGQVRCSLCLSLDPCTSALEIPALQRFLLGNSSLETR